MHSKPTSIADNGDEGEGGKSPNAQPVMLCKHDWEPLQKWLGRFKCKICKSVGYTHNRNSCFGGVRHQGHITPYRCYATRCIKWAQHIVIDYALCDDHKSIKSFGLDKEYAAIVEKENERVRQKDEEAFRRMREHRDDH